MQPKCTKVQFTGQHVYVGIDVAKKSWKVCIYVDDAYHKRFSQLPEPDALVEYLHRNFPGATYHSVYEAGYFGFWIHRGLARLGVDSMVINPADVPTTDREQYQVILGVGGFLFYILISQESSGTRSRYCLTTEGERRIM